MGVIAELVQEVVLLWQERHQARPTALPRKRAVGADAKDRLVFVDRLPATFVHLRHGGTRDVLACWFGVHRSTILPAVGEVRPLLAGRGCTVSPGARLRTQADLVDRLGASGATGVIDGTEIRVRRPAAGRKDRDKCISGKNKQNAFKSMVVADGEGRMLWCSPTGPASCADIIHARQLGLVQLLADGPAVWRISPMPATRAWARRPATGRWHHRTASSRRTPWTGTRRCTNASAWNTPHVVSGSSTASPI
ncbi:transposase family protein [Streptomyces sp. WZ.A104]|uniref:transposase family protein n=1 Tax=Streptomyces sp. WZ.A104 TaxID=2023771 RepID=UPI00211C56CC|nr:transposase family protein [Streptomyces sp. WZ.A104]